MARGRRDGAEKHRTGAVAESSRKENGGPGPAEPCTPGQGQMELEV